MLSTSDDAADPGPVDGAAGAEPEAVPPERARYVDLLRVAAVGMVVLGHWLITSVTYQGGRFQAADVLTDIPWAPWGTWGFQVMPVFFLCGGYASAVSWGRARDAGRPAEPWLRRRARRLLLPTTWYVLCAVTAMVLCRAAGVPTATLALAGWAIALHLWFLPVYLALSLLTPLMYEAHRRWGLAVPAAMAYAGALVDVVVITWHVGVLGWSGYLLVWGAVYQAGFCWRDGLLTARRRLPALLAAAGAAAFVALVVFGPFPVSLVGLTGTRIDNTAPPSAALAAYAAAQVGLLVAAEPAFSRLLRRPRLWRLVRACDRRVMAVYLWHMAPVAVAIPLLYPTHVMPEPAVGGAAWWELRPLWLAGLAVLLSPLILVRVRAPVRLDRGAEPGHGYRPLLWAGIAMAGAALARFAISGFAPGGWPSPATTALYVAGVVVATMVVRLPDTRPAGLGHVR